jgi:hypothetical protein
MLHCIVGNLIYTHISEKRSAFIFYGLWPFSFKAVVDVKLHAAQHYMPEVHNP